MRARIFEISHLKALTHLIGVETLDLIDLPGRRATLSSSPGEADLHVRRRKAFGIVMSTSFMGGSEARGTPRERIENALASDHTALSWSGEGMLLVVDCCVEVPERPIDQIIDYGDFAVGFDVATDEVVAESAQEVRSAALAGLAISQSEHAVYDSRQLGTATMVTDPITGKPIYSASFKSSFSVSSRSAITQSSALDAARISRLLLDSPASLRHVPRLLMQSYERRGDPVDTFIAAWTGLEVLVAAAFKKYEAVLGEALRGAVPGGSVKTVERMRTVMSDKYRLLDKFAIMAGVLDEGEAERDVETFARLKAARDRFFHTMAVDPETLPAGELRQLLRKYLTLHLHAA